MSTGRCSKNPNPFEDVKVAEEWIEAIESEKNGSRDNEIYPMLYSWTHNLKPRTIVEIGSGQGVCSSKIDLTSSEYLGIEPSTILNQRARELYTEEKKKFLEGDVYNIPLPSLKADAVFSVGVWFHIEDLDRAHKEVARILKPGGELLIITANANLIRVWESFFYNPKKDGKVVEGKVKTPSGELSWNIFYFHSEKEITESLTKSSFTIESVRKFGFGTEGEKEHRDEGIWMAIRAQKV